MRARNTPASAVAAQSGTDFSGAMKNVLSGTIEDMDRIFDDAAAKYGLSANLIKAVAKAESNFNSKAVSRSGAVGVMQLMPGTAKLLGVSDSYDARQNIMGGAKYLKENLDRFGDVRLALAAYNAGPNSVKKYGGVPPYEETQNYVKKVMSYLEGTPIYANKSVVTGADTGYGTGAGSSLAGTGPVRGIVPLYSNGQSLALGSGRSAALGGTTLGSAASSGYTAQQDYINQLKLMGQLAGMGQSLGTDSLLGTGVSSGLGSLFGTGPGGNQLLGSSLLGGSLFGSDSVLGLAQSLAAGGDGATVTIDKDSFVNLLQIMRLQMLMNADREVGAMANM